MFLPFGLLIGIILVTISLLFAWSVWDYIKSIATSPSLDSHYMASDDPTIRCPNVTKSNELRRKILRAVFGGSDLWRGVSPIYDAIATGDEKRFEKLITKGVSVHGDSQTFSPLSVAAGACDPLFVKTLLAKGADVNGRSYIKEDGTLGDRQEGADSGWSTPLHEALLHRDIWMIQYLIQNGADVNIKDVSYETIEKDPEFAQGRTPIQTAFATSQYRIAEALLQAGADPRHKPDIFVSVFNTMEFQKTSVEYPYLLRVRDYLVKNYPESFSGLREF